MSVNVVVPPSSISRHPRRVPQRTKSAVTFLLSAGKMNFSSQSCSFRSSAMPRKRLMAACVWVLIKPGARMASGRSRRCFAGKRASMSAFVLTARMRSPLMATAPLSMTRRCARVVLTWRALQMMSAGWAASARTKRKKLKIRDIEGLREKVFQSIGFGFAAQVDQHQLHVSAKLPENLPAGAAGRGQIFGIGGHRHAAELADAFGDGLEHGDAFGAKCQPVGGILHVAAGMNPPVAVFNRRAHQELGEGRERVQ